MDVKRYNKDLNACMWLSKRRGKVYKTWKKSLGCMVVRVMQYKLNMKEKLRMACDTVSCMLGGIPFKFLKNNVIRLIHTQHSYPL